MIIRAAAALAIALMICALLLPAYTVPWESEPDVRYSYRGFEALIFGWAAVLSGVSFAWLANVTWGWGVLRMLRGSSPNVWASLVGLVLATLSLTPFDAFLLDDTAGDVARPAFGATLFVASNAVIALVALTASWQHLRIAQDRG